MLEHGERPEDELERAEGEQQVDSQHRQHERAAARVERDRVDAEQRPTREQRAERQPSPPVEAEADERLAELQLARANDDDGAVHEGRGQRPGEHEEQPERRDPKPADHHGHHERRQRRIEEEEPPRLVVEVGRSRPERSAGAHPFTPAVVTPAMK